MPVQLQDQRTAAGGAHGVRCTGLFASAAREDVALAAEARDATRSLEESREWRLLLLEFVVHAARTPSLAPKLQAHERRFRTAVAELLDQRLTQRGIAPPLPIDDPGSAPDELLGDLLPRLLARTAPGDEPSTAIESEVVDA